MPYRSQRISVPFSGMPAKPEAARAAIINARHARMARREVPGRRRIVFLMVLQHTSEAVCGHPRYTNRMLAMQSRYCRVFVVVLLLDFGGKVLAQAPAPRARASSDSSLVFVHIRDSGGHLLRGVSVTVNGPTSGEFTTDVEGVVRLQSMRDGVYHLR